MFASGKARLSENLGPSKMKRKMEVAKKLTRALSLWSFHAWFSRLREDFELNGKVSWKDHGPHFRNDDHVIV